MSSEAETRPDPPSSRAAALAGLATVLLLLAFLAGIRGLGDGFKLLGGDLLKSFFSATSNPFIALMVGILTTTLVQSSSVTTSMVVGLVAAPESPLPLANAVPMIMGANIGTTATNTIVSIAHMGRRTGFRRAFSVATCHDFFNFLSVLVLLPLGDRDGLPFEERRLVGGPTGRSWAAATSTARSRRCSRPLSPRWAGWQNRASNRSRRRAWCWCCAAAR